MEHWCVDLFAPARTDFQFGDLNLDVGVTVNELADYAIRKVTLLTAGGQHLILRQELPATDWTV